MVHFFAWRWACTDDAHGHAPPCVTFYEGTLVNGSLKKRPWLARVVEKGRLSPTDFLPEV